jgi:hypothetical protein
MLTRARWFAYGSAATLGLTMIVVSKARSMRERLDTDGVTRVSVHLAADGIESIGRRLQRSALRVAPDGSAGEQG